MNKERKKESHIIVALDRMRPEKALELASLLNGKVWGFKANDLLVISFKNSGFTFPLIPIFNPLLSLIMRGIYLILIFDL